MSDEEDFIVTIDQNPKIKRNIKLLSILSTVLFVGICVGFIICLSILGIGQQIFNNYPELFYADNIFSKIKEIWVGIRWQVWVGLICITIFFGVILIKKYKQNIKEL